ncbi:hypothetical protein EX30DRAFT_160461 [Ascodesmis nigricans]|uniref:Uncharacterized protein n=1 Tax=Ascodesmis nigricans TaxID=341454 RepID=A0A4S2MMU4_9PEZI|nr:hypothetical protein EX30DRAFT_160461 [Ascodesmis nigricans]
MSDSRNETHPTDGSGNTHIDSTRTGDRYETFPSLSFSLFDSGGSTLSPTSPGAFFVLSIFFWAGQPAFKLQYGLSCFEFPYWVSCLFWFFFGSYGFGFFLLGWLHFIFLFSVWDNAFWGVSKTLVVAKLWKPGDTVRYGITGTIRHNTRTTLGS